MIEGATHAHICKSDTLSSRCGRHNDSGDNDNRTSEMVTMTRAMISFSIFGLPAASQSLYAGH